MASEEQLQALLNKLRAADPLWREREEFGALLMHHIDTLTPAEHARYDELEKLLSEQDKPTFPPGCEVTVDQVVHAARKAIREMQFDVRPTRTWGNGAREAVDGFESVASMFERQTLAPQEKPVAWTSQDALNELEVRNTGVMSPQMSSSNNVPLWTSPQSPMRPLTDRAIDNEGQRQIDEADPEAKDAMALRDKGWFILGARFARERLSPKVNE